MSFWIILGMAVALAMDCFAVSLGMSCSREGLTGKQAVRMGLFFGFFQFAMPVAGWFAGENIIRYIQGFDHWIAFGLLAFVGGKMIVESFIGEGDRKNHVDRTCGLPLIVLSVATSIDALAVGLSMAAIGVNALGPAAIIGLVSFLMTILGAKLGPVLGRIVGRRAELAGGLVLIAIGVKILIDHL
jgi:manganese efflux pump family protein